MASKSQVSIALLLSLNLVFFTVASSTCHNGICPPPPLPFTCQFLLGLADLDAAVCICAALKSTFNLINKFGTVNGPSCVINKNHY
ncbi:putative lipid-binding protein AIR1B [Humulus lupulus]|uniref:putative lipid-binding protein AIR1B n=1 Tax=Humulus lupulus TaxID=3486 RepID=UPI002B40B1DE|nr:putative lipid-binding protein AIR1B [Humulus lupulus]